MDETQAMTIIQLKSAADALVSKMVHAAYRVPFKIVSICFQCNLKMLYLVIDSYLKICDMLQNVIGFKFIYKKKTNESEATVNEQEIVRGVKRLRRSLIANIDQYYDLKFKADNEEAVKRLDELRDSVTGSNENFLEALDRVDEMKDRLTEERKEFFKEVEELQLDEIIEELNEDQCIENNRIGEVDHNQVSDLSREQEALDMKLCYRQLNYIRNRVTSSRRNGSPKNRFNTTNMKLEQILRVSSNLVEELNKLNHQVGHLADVSERMAGMQYQLGVGRELLSEVEADRNEMKRKLVTLERLIKEEEKYLNDFSYESGFEENERPVSL